MMESPSAAFGRIMGASSGEGRMATCTEARGLPSQLDGAVHFRGDKFRMSFNADC